MRDRTSELRANLFSIKKKKKTQQTDEAANLHLLPSWKRFRRSLMRKVGPQEVHFICCHHIAEMRQSRFGQLSLWMRLSFLQLIRNLLRLLHKIRVTPRIERIPRKRILLQKRLNKPRNRNKNTKTFSSSKTMVADATGSSRRLSLCWNTTSFTNRDWGSYNTFSDRKFLVKKQSKEGKATPANAYCFLLPTSGTAICSAQRIENFWFGLFGLTFLIRTNTHPCKHWDQLKRKATRKVPWREWSVSPRTNSKFNHPHGSPKRLISCVQTHPDEKKKTLIGLILYLHMREHMSPNIEW